MVDIGDLREGVWFDNAVSEVSEALNIKGIEVVGIGTNLGCFGGVIPSKDNMQKLLDIKSEIEKYWYYPICSIRRYLCNFTAD